MGDNSKCLFIFAADYKGDNMPIIRSNCLFVDS